MDADRFESLLRAFATTPSRRTTIRLLTGAVLGTFLTVGALPAAAKKRKPRPASCPAPCVECQACRRPCTKNKAGKKRCRPSRCQAAGALQGTPCSGNGVCQDGQCGCQQPLIFDAEPSPQPRQIVVRCGGICVDTREEPNCGGCGITCPLNSHCTGACSCVYGVCGMSAAAANCCAAGSFTGCSCSPAGGALFDVPAAIDCQPEAVCPAGTSPCVGAPGTCQACCPDGAACDPSTGTCRKPVGAG